MAAALLSVAAAVLVVQISPAGRETTPVVVAAGSLGAGTVLSSADLRIADYPVALVPSPTSPDPGTEGTGGDPASIDHWVGRTLSTAVVEGQPLTGPGVVGPDLLTGQPAGSTAVTVRVADPGALTHVRPGQRVDLVQPGTGSGIDEDPEPQNREKVVARAVTVLWVAGPAEPDPGLLSASSAGSDRDLLVVGADTRTAQSIAGNDSHQLVPVLVSAGDSPAPDSPAPGPSPSAADAEP